METSPIGTKDKITSRSKQGRVRRILNYAPALGIAFITGAGVVFLLQENTEIDRGFYTISKVERTNSIEIVVKENHYVDITKGHTNEQIKELRKIPPRVSELCNVVNEHDFSPHYVFYIQDRISWNKCFIALQKEYADLRKLP
ncbi:MAG: hypothetical protein M3Q44_03365 [bacterium]|nr:hypothetical protein [bacterium]